MKLCSYLQLVAIAAALAACSGEEELHSGSPCPAGERQECKGDEDSVRCTCVGGTGDAGSEGGDAGPTEAGEPDAPGD
jgi:hypothetical protein